MDDAGRRPASQERLELVDDIGGRAGGAGVAAFGVASLLFADTVDLAGKFLNHRLWIPITYWSDTYWSGIYWSGWATRGALSVPPNLARHI